MIHQLMKPIIENRKRAFQLISFAILSPGSLKSLSTNIANNIILEAYNHIVLPCNHQINHKSAIHRPLIQINHELTILFISY